MKTELNFTSLLPPATEPGQALAISRIDWTLPFSAVDVRFGFSPTAIQVDKVSSGFAEGHASLGAFRVDLANPGRIDGAADLKSISLAALIAASNLGSKVKLEGKVSGHMPFTAGPEGFQIVNGHVQADGAGRLSIDRSLWAQGDAAVSTNAVQDFAYQALENLAFSQMTADLNSIAGRPVADRLPHQGPKRSAQAAKGGSRAHGPAERHRPAKAHSAAQRHAHRPDLGHFP